MPRSRKRCRYPTRPQSYEEPGTFQFHVSRLQPPDSHNQIAAETAQATTTTEAADENLRCITDILPIELWLQVIRFKNLSQHDYSNFSLVCRQLRELAQPLVFKTYKFTRWAMFAGQPQTAAKHKKYMERFPKRLDFVQSNRIAPGVLRIELQSLEHSKRHLGRDTSKAIDQLFSVLPRLINVSEIIAWCILTPFRLSQVYQLQSLEFLRFSGFVVADSVVGKQQPCSALLALSLMDCRSERAISPKSNLLSLLSPRITRSITMYSRAQSWTTVQWIASGSVMKQLQYLELSEDVVTSRSFIPALLQCPVLRTLCLKPKYVDPPRPVGAAVVTTIDQLLRTKAAPDLAIVEASASCILPFIQARPLRRIRTEGDDFMDVDLAFSIVKEIRQQRPNFTHLVVQLQQVSSEWLVAALTLPSLECLSVQTPGYLSAALIDQVRYFSCFCVSASFLIAQ